MASNDEIYQKKSIKILTEIFKDSVLDDPEDIIKYFKEIWNKTGHTTKKMSISKKTTSQRCIANNKKGMRCSLKVSKQDLNLKFCYAHKKNNDVNEDSKEYIDVIMSTFDNMYI